MKRVLLITTDFPGLGGARTFKFARYLPRFGYEPIVLTNRIKQNTINDRILKSELGGNVRISKAFCINKSPFRIFSKFFGLWGVTVYFEKLFFIPDLYITMMPSAYWICRRLIKQEGIRVVITSSPPESMHILGLLLRITTGVSWIADFRDLWTVKTITNKPPTAAHGMIMRRLESLIYKSCDHIIANTEGNRNIYTDRFGVSSEKITVITNGYDLEDVIGGSNNMSGGNRNIFSIGYMGNFDKAGFPWKEFLSAFARLLKSDDSIAIEVNLYGHVSDQAKRYFVKQGLERHIHCHGNLAHHEAMVRLRTSHLLLVLLYETEYSNAIVPHKLYHYLGLGKPIMAVAEEHGEVAKILDRTGAGKAVSAAKPNEIFRLLSDYYNQWKNFNSIHYSTNKEEIQKYENSFLVQRLSEIIGSFTNI